jgi:hypothetical protein
MSNLGYTLTFIGTAVMVYLFERSLLSALMMSTATLLGLRGYYRREARERRP